MKASVFYSWQSDLPPDAAKEFLRSALEEAVSLLTEDASLIVRPELDHDTRNVPGSPPMVAAILDKIDRCSVFVGDVTLTFQRHVSQPPRLAPNPNVMLELGYALKRLGHQRVLLLMASQYGGPEALPFDLRGYRVIEFDLAARQKLVEELRDALHLILSKVGAPSDLVPPVSITLKVKHERIESKYHAYRLPVRVRNMSDDVISDWSVHVVFPKALLNPNQGYPNVADTPDRQLVSMRQTQSGHSWPFYPNDEREVMGIDYHMDDDLFDKRDALYKLPVTVTFFVGTKMVAREVRTVADLVNY